MPQVKSPYSVHPEAVQKARLLELIDQFKGARVMVIGDFILDRFIWGSVDRISPEAPVPVVHIQRESYMPGGCLNVANNIRHLGGTVFPCGIFGRDLEGRMLLKVIRQRGIDTGGMVYDSRRPTSLKTRIIAHSQQVVRFDRENTEEIAPEVRKKLLHFIRRRIQDVDVLVIEDYGKGVINPPLLKAIVKIAKKTRKPVLVDPKEKHFAYYEGVTAITPNRKEAFGALENNHRSRDYTVEQVGKLLARKLKCQAVLMTLGEDGMMLCERKGPVTKIPTAAQEVYDVSGAGDTVIAVFGLAIAAGASMREAAVLSNLAAGIVVGKLGTATVLPEELKKKILEDRRA